MAHQYQSGVPTQSPTDQHGNPVQRKDEYGNPIHDVTMMDKIKEKLPGGATGHHDVTTGYGGEEKKPGMVEQIKDKVTGLGGTAGHHDVTTGYGGEEKKPGMVEQIKEKLPGGTAGHHDVTNGYGGEEKKPGMVEQIRDKVTGGTAAGHETTPGYGVGGAHPENKGMLDQIKENLPRGHKEDPYTVTSVAPPHHEEEKGVMDKIKDKLPGGGHGTTH